MAPRKPPQAAATGGVVKNDAAHLRELIEAGHPCISITTLEEGHALQQVKAVVADTPLELWVWSVTTGLRAGTLDGAAPINETEHPAGALAYIGTLLVERSVCVMLDLVAHLDDARTLRVLREAIARAREAGHIIILIDHRGDLPPAIGAEATPHRVALPDVEELETIVLDMLRGLMKYEGAEVALTRSELGIVTRNLCGLSRTQARQIIRDCVASDARFDREDLNHILAAKRRALHQDGLLEYVEAPTDLSDIGGLHGLKTWLAHRSKSLSHDAVAFGLTPPRGVLMLGVQGAGKSLCAKAIATAWNRPLLRLDPGRLYDRYIGQSEHRLRSALDQAESMAPIVLWIDEIEKGFASAASRSSDGGLSQRMFGTLLTWMQEHTAPVFLVATANDIAALPPELLRKGRFDEIFFVDLPDQGVRREIFAIHLRKRGRDPEAFDLHGLADASEGYSGAEIEQAIVAAMHEAFSRSEELDTDAVTRALRRSPPLSVTMAERVAHLREWARGRCVPAD